MSKDSAGGTSNPFEGAEVSGRCSHGVMRVGSGCLIDMRRYDFSDVCEDSKSVVLGIYMFRQMGDKTIHVGSMYIDQNFSNLEGKQAGTMLGYEFVLERRRN